MNYKNFSGELKLAIGLLLFVCLMRLSLPPILPHLSNFSPLTAVVMMSATFFRKPLKALVFTLFLLFVSDLLVNTVMYHNVEVFYPGFYWQYISYLAVFAIGLLLSLRASFSHFMAGALGSSLLFYTVSNFGVWLSGLLYPKTMEGLLACYIAGLPFLQNSMVSNLVFTAVLFASTQMLVRKNVLLMR